MSTKTIDPIPEGVLRDLIVEACKVLNHDNDVPDGNQAHEIWARRELKSKFSEILKKHGHTIPTSM